MCGIVGAIAQRDVSDILLEGLRRLEYRGYDSAGIAVVYNNEIQRIRSLGKVNELVKAVGEKTLAGGLGIAHTRWATHGKPSVNNAHPHVAGPLAIVHNGIIENYIDIKNRLIEKGHQFTSETDTEVFVALVNSYLEQEGNLLNATKRAIKDVKGAYGTVVIDKNEPEHLVAARSGSPIVIGLGIGENFVASDPVALFPITHRFIYLEEGDIADVSRFKIVIYDKNGNVVNRAVNEVNIENDEAVKGEYRHFMQKEIYEQTKVVTDTLAGRISDEHFVVECFGTNARDVFSSIERVKIVACGTSYHAGLMAREWFESLAGIPTDVEIASEFRYRKSITQKNTLFVTLSQSGETADTLAAVRIAKQKGYAHTLCICNVPGSSLVRESELVFLTRAGREICVASTKAFTTQLVSLLLLVGSIGVVKGTISSEDESGYVASLRKLAPSIEKALALDSKVEEISREFVNKRNALFLGRGAMYPIAMEGALKLKEISYIHAEAYAAGELKHGPIALIDADMPVIVVAPNNDLLAKLRSNIEEVSARRGILYVFGTPKLGLTKDPNIRFTEIDEVDELIAPIVYNVILQLLAYYVAIIKGTDVDKPRNLAKSVTVE
ncbi:MAG: glutamine--fructose-6-phosphate transaminase (isomerizing) [Ruminobacter sp.]|jgi:glucosamine--fructose-6-phosphate aminotransferase (isomerizing)|uniref:Glutamine--fructose-6-phosphate aminotransferase [isomerizing] n=1 Tax=Ruminobacter amylophilus TaxID=867 RepID=A0A662ZIN4_9GAMM|nr:MULTISPECIES: glutamine--fructose-6-phosphate transaminase (isomerizing) [Ruminobacter]MBQ3775126.1 glutamine--fructose-6-phosphate transaminase (isomerizing) [Ruminobacter sp.]SFP56344.1 glucosamine--fructose-6-phosphate aminotransferase (isomerizing) [Ruminobacter amylophilus]